ncbi:MAG: hypothetical protein EBX15_02880, partial [Acidimicrobiia bacterium]|nr:hypothetical protein [Acidimicrobiia bacterium]
MSRAILYDHESLPIRFARQNEGMSTSIITYPPEVEKFRAEVRSWLESNLPKGWFDEGFEMSNDERKKFNEEWPNKLFQGGWICATWPKEYG